MSLHPHLIGNPQPTAIWRPHYSPDNSCQLCNDLLLVTFSGCISCSNFVSQHFWPSWPSLLFHPLFSQRICGFWSSWFSLSISGYFSTVSFLASYSSLSISDVLILLRLLFNFLFSFSFQVGSEDHPLQGHGIELYLLKCRLVSYFQHLLNKTLLSWNPGFWILSGFLGNSSDLSLRITPLNIFPV